MEVTGVEIIDVEEEGDTEVVEAGTEERVGEVGEEEVITETDTGITGMIEVETTGEIGGMIKTQGEMIEDTEEMIDGEDETGTMIIERVEEEGIMTDEIEIIETGHDQDQGIEMRGADLDPGAQGTVEENLEVKTGVGDLTRSRAPQTQLRTLAQKTGQMMRLLLVRKQSLLLKMKHLQTKVTISMLTLQPSLPTLTNNFSLHPTEVMKTQHTHNQLQMQAETKRVSCENLHYFSDCLYNTTFNFTFHTSFIWTFLQKHFKCQRNFKWRCYCNLFLFCRFAFEYYVEN